MTELHQGNRCLAVGLVLLLLIGSLFFGMIRPSEAAPPPGGRDQGRHDPAPRDRGPAAPGAREFRDSRYQHNRYYPVYGAQIPRLPRDHRVVLHNRTRYYFSGGAWYRPQGARYVVVTPPIGLFVSFLPPFYTTIWVGGAPYYYANDVYYAHRGGGYVVVAPPKEEVSEVPPPADNMFVYPRQGQSEAQQATDRYECHRWAYSQTGFDPTQPAAGSDTSGEKRANYQRAMSACLDGRGYTVK